MQLEYVLRLQLVGNWDYLAASFRHGKGKNGRDNKKKHLCSSRLQGCFLMIWELSGRQTQNLTSDKSYPG